MADGREETRALAECRVVGRAEQRSSSPRRRAACRRRLDFLDITDIRYRGLMAFV